MNIVLLCNKIIEYAFYSLFFLVPLVFFGSTSELFEFNKMWLTFVITIIIFVSWGTKMIAERQFKIAKTPFDWFILLFLASQIIATLSSLDPHVSFWGYYSRFNGGLLSTISYCILYYAFVTNVLPINELQQPEAKRSITLRAILFFCGLALPFVSMVFFANQSSSTLTEGALFISFIVSCFCFIFALRGAFLTRFLGISLLSAVMVALWGLPSHFGNDPTCYVFRGTFDVSCWTDAFRPTIRMFSTLGQPAWLAAYLAALLPLSIAYFLNSLGRKPTAHSIFSPTAISYFLVTMVFYACLLYTNTRAGFLGFWAANGVFWLCLFIRKTFPLKHFFLSFLVVNAVFFLLNFFIGTPLNQLNIFTLNTLRNTQQPTTSVSTAGENKPASQQTTYVPDITDSGKIRLYVWQGAIEAWKKNPIFGTGVETFAFAYYKYKPEGHNKTSEWDYLYNKAHNEYLNYLATTGIIGLGSYLLIIGGVMFYISKKQLASLSASDSSAGVLLVPAIFAGWISILITNFFGFSVVIMNIFFFIFPAIAYIVYTNTSALAYYALPHDEQKSSHISISQWAGILFLLLLGMFMLGDLYTYWQADRLYALGSNYARANDYQQGYPLLQKAYTMKPNEPMYKDEFSLASSAIAQLFFSENEATKAAGFAQQAMDLNDEVLTNHPNNIVFWKSRIRILYSMGQLDSAYLAPALKAAEKASELAPNDAKILYNLGVLYGQNGQSEKGISVLDKTIALRPNYEDAYYARALFYRDLAIDTNGTVMKPDMQQKANASIQYIIEHLNPKNEQAKNTLNEWKE